MTHQIWTLEQGDSPLVATAIHAGSQIRDELVGYLAIDAEARRREEDPYTDFWTQVAATRVVATASRFQVDLNRARDKAVYLSPIDAWGLDVWNQELPPQMIAHSLAEYDSFYRAMAKLFAALSKKHGRFVVFDLHSYNHRRVGPDAPPANAESNPQVNIGTGTMGNRSLFAPVVECFIETFGTVEFPTGPLDIRENIKFRGGQFAKWIHSRYPDSACVLSIEFKKFYMDEWTGNADPLLLEAIRGALASTVLPVLETLEAL